ncbi:lantibiotic dehydratase C-terminal domain-containing protein [Amycolatopsis orientalis]|uniref:lantibiotic dehydratase C-terminal domain-containing protein n=1 Tax=Amycolatopsis orientalis TaxID=31958 RepID=UPI000419F919|nr:lantibiotic dehydratase C-terminal domain-containing protein [Amycolatopsis orientalis]
MTEMAGTVRDVVCHYHDPLQAPLLREAVLPTLAALPEVTAHLERGWLHGPHLRIRLSGPAGSAERLATALERYLREHPSRAALSEVDLQALATAAGRAELVPPPYGPFRPDNSVHVEDPDPATRARFPGGPATAAVRDHLLALGVPAVAVTVADAGEHADKAGARVRAVMTVLSAHAEASPGGLDKRYFSYQSHLEAHLHVTDEDGRIRARHDTLWQAHADRARRIVRHADDLDEPLVAAWRSWGGAARTVAAAAYDRGELRSADAGETSAKAAAFDDPLTARIYLREDVSEFHRLLGEVWSPDTGDRREFEIERFVMNILYLLLAVCDVRPAERYLAAALVCRAVESITGMDWRARIERARRHQLAAGPR